MVINQVYIMFVRQKMCQTLKRLFLFNIYFMTHFVESRIVALESLAFATALRKFAENKVIIQVKKVAVFFKVCRILIKK